MFRVLATSIYSVPGITRTLLLFYVPEILPCSLIRSTTTDFRISQYSSTHIFYSEYFLPGILHFPVVVKHCIFLQYCYIPGTRFIIILVIWYLVSGMCACTRVFTAVVFLNVMGLSLVLLPPPIVHPLRLIIWQKLTRSWFIMIGSIIWSNSLMADSWWWVLQLYQV